ncbi:pyocin knob domain-containing S74 family peptidase [Pseudomonas sp. JH-2]|uniref:pyocin knob domain-containing S74 family peptidase n=1 Tax=Pseudomonas sp. JH-2 TaxID=3114998 RepID=UPI002E253B96|nr:pyocin knob domain-containing S74 family peptidase [Pseudomonas sp. JH-2]
MVQRKPLVSGNGFPTELPSGDTIAGAEPPLTAGTTSQFYRGDKTWQDLAAAVRAAVLTGLSTATNAAVVATDTLLVGLGKLQAQINAREPTITAGTTSQFWRGDKTWQDLGAAVRSTVLTGLSTATATAVTATDSVLVGLGKLQAQVNNKLDATATAVAAQKLAPGANINGVLFDGTGDITVADSTKEPAITGGTTSQFWRGDKSWVDFATTVRTVVLTGLSTATSAAVVATDTLLVGMGKLQAQINTLSTGKEPTITAGTTSQFWRGDKSWQDLATAVRASVLTGLSTATATAIAATDSVLVAFGKLQAQVNNKLDATGTAAAASKLSPGANINGVPFDGTSNVSVTANPTQNLIPNSTDLNSLYFANGYFGEYYCASDANAQTMSNCPTTHAFVLKITHHNDTRQELSEYMTTAAKTWYRNRYAGNWGSWFRVYSESDPQPNATDTTKEPAITAGATSQYWRGDKAWADFATSVRAAVLTGYAVGTNAALAATDTVLAAFGKVQAQLNGKEPLVTAGTTAQFWRGDKAWTDFATTVRATVLTGYAVGSNAALAATDTVLAAFGKIQAQLNAKEGSVTAGTTSQFYRGDKSWQDLATAVRAVVLTGLSTATATAISATDSILVAMGKLQAQLNGKAASGSNSDITDLNTLATATWGINGRIYGDMSNGSQSSRLLFQTSTANGGTSVGAIPNGTGTISNFVAYNSQDAGNAGYVQMLIASTEASIRSGATGSGTVCPLVFYMGGTVRATLDVNGAFCFWSPYADPIAATSAGASLGPWGIRAFRAGGSAAGSFGVNTTGAVLNFYFNTGGVGSVSTNGSTVAFNTSSDPRLKDEISDLDNAEEIFDSIEWKKWLWKANHSLGYSYGVLAPDLKRVFPSAVVGDENAVDEEGNIVAMGVDYSKLVPILGGKIKAQAARIAVLEEQLQQVLSRLPV